MSTRWCPQCHSEFREGFDVCEECGVALVDALAPPPAEAHPSSQPQQPDTPFLPGDDVVELTTLAIVEAELVAAQLRVAGIPASVFSTGVAVYTGVQRARVMVRRSDFVDAEQFVAQLSAEQRSGTPLTDEELTALAEESTDGSDPATGAVV